MTIQISLDNAKKSWRKHWIAFIFLLFVIFISLYVVESGRSSSTTSSNQIYSTTDQTSGNIPITKKSISNVHVHFLIDSGSPIECGITCRQTTATLTNSGDETAQNVNVKFWIKNNVGKNVYSDNIALGDIPGGQSKTDTITINANCGFLALDCLNHKPLNLNIEVDWNGGSQTFVQQYSG